VFCQYWCSVASLPALWRSCGAAAVSWLQLTALARHGPVTGLAGASIHWWQAWWLDLCCAEGGIDLGQCSGVCQPLGDLSLHAQQAAVCHWEVGGSKGPECVTHDALSGLNHMPITSD